ncbi:ATP-dependent RNA helicase DHX29-like isoform X2 [Acanthaster planci]|nr:ATP-dependent RNA helicase DHX29-like isoform X2 [Acanthaster planci]XP_022087055.1 ATP-dependent RNA helicase DHX29-like isoform X2 [Acanthaster planci]XP_022087056.1 ATP-dependent RNA helicase DHX29-like isoform X2 [Acanthaster planci]
MADGRTGITAVQKKYRFQTPDGGVDANIVEDKTVARVSLPAALEKAIVEEILRQKSLSNSLGTVSRKMSAKKLTDLYMALADVGFQHEQITAAMSNNLVQGGDLHSALDWLCLNLPDNELPTGFAGTFLEEGRQENKEKARTPFMEEQRTDDSGPRKKELDSTKETEKSGSQKADVKNWILQYAEAYSDEEEEEGPDSMQQEDVDPTEQYLVLAAQLLDAKAAASQAKQEGDKSAQTQAGKEIARLAKEITKVESHPDFDPRAKLHVELQGDGRQDIGTEEATPSSSEKKRKKQKRTEKKEEEEEDAGMFNLFSEEPGAVSSSKTASRITADKQEDIRGFAYSQKNWTGKSPKQFLIDWCRKNLPNTAAPKYHKTEVRGKWKCKLTIDRKKEPPLVVKPDILTENAMEAQHVASVLALWNLAKTTSIHQLLPPPYRDLWLEWRDAESKAKEEIKTEENKPRDQFVAQLLKKLKLQSTSDGASTNRGTAETNEGIQESWEDHIGNVDEKQCTSSSSGDVRKRSVTGTTLRSIMQHRQKSDAYHKMLATRQTLPVYQHRDAILSHVKSSPVVIVAGETGSGKSTQVPQFLLEHLVMSGKTGHANIVCTQPRRISATSLARRVSQEMAEKGPGSKDSLCGYQIRMESKQCPTTRLLYCTTGVLLRKLQLDPKLQDISHIIVDEVHERSVQSDFLMVIVKSLLQLRRDLRVILMSATMESAKLSAYFQHCPVVSIPGRTFPVRVHHIEDMVEQTKYILDSDSPYAMRYESLTQEEHTTVSVTGKGGQTKDVQVSWDTQDISTLDESGLNPDVYSKRTRQVLTRLNWDRINMDLIMELIHFLGEDPFYGSIDGAVLVFMPGLADIQELYELLQSDSRFPTSKYRILALHSVLSSEDQSSAFDIPPSGVRKVVIATNIAETGITIPDAVFVIDSGKVKETRYNEMSQLSALVETNISKASAKQRQGRAGRVREGFCFRLYTKKQYESFKSFSPPEILRVPLEDLCLHIMKCNLGSPEDLLQQCLDAPQLNTIRAAMSLLREVGACKIDTPSLTPLGQHLAALPVNVRVGKMLLFAAIFGCLEPMAVIAAAMTDKQPFIVPMGKRQQADLAKKALAIAHSDHITVYKVYAGWEEAAERGRAAEMSYCYHNFLSRTTLLSIKDVKNDLIKLIQSIGFDDSLATDVVPFQRARRSSLGHTHTPGDVLEISKVQPKGPKFPLTHGNVALLKAALTAGLYPNVAKTTYSKPIEGAREPKKICLAETTKGNVAVHPASVNRELLTNGWLLYIEKVKLSRVFIRDNTLVSAYPLLLFGGALAVQHREKLITVDEWIKFQAPAKTAVIFKELRNLLNSTLVRKLSQPGLKIRDETVVQLMMELIQSERCSS